MAAWFVLGRHVMGEFRNMPALIYAAVRHIGPYTSVSTAFERIVGWARKSGLIRPQTKVIGLAWDKPFAVPAGKLRYDAAVTIDRRVEVPSDIHIAALPAMTWFMTTHRGGYGSIADSFMKLGSEMGQRDDVVHVPLCSLEIYLNGPGTPEADLRTEIGLPVVRLS